MRKGNLLPLLPPCKVIRARPSTHNEPLSGSSLHTATLFAGSPFSLTLNPEVLWSPLNPAHTYVNKLLQSPQVIQGEAVISLLPGPEQIKYWPLEKKLIPQQEMGTERAACLGEQKDPAATPWPPQSGMANPW